MKEFFKCDGLNIGINLGGKAAGGSVPGHLHIHMLPRWYGDVSSMMALFQTHIIPLDMNKLWEQLSEKFEAIAPLLALPTVTPTPSGAEKKESKAAIAEFRSY